MSIHTLSKTRLALSLMIAFLIIGTVISTVIVFNYSQTGQVNSVRSRVNTLALAVDANDIQQLSGTEADLETKSYQDLKLKLINLKQVNPDITFVYLMGVRGNEIFFLADSELEDSEDYSPPGQIYDEATPILINAFKDRGPMQEVSKDRWGNWLSVFAPIFDPNTGTVVAIAGFDMPYNSYITTVFISSSIPVAIGLVFTILLIGAWIVAKKDETLLHIRSEYFSIAAHDLRAPLTGIKWAVMSLVNSKPTAPPKYQTMLKEITKTADNMILSVNELLDGSAMESGKAKKLLVGPIKMQDLMANAFKPLAISAQEKSIQVTWEMPKQPITIQGDADKLRRVFANLFSNAIKYSNDGGAVFVAVKLSDEKVTITVADSGIGIPKSEQNKVFEGYFRATNAKTHTTQGTGLGLYYVKNIIDSHGGEISLDSSAERGTTITVKLPLDKKVLK